MIIGDSVAVTMSDTVAMKPGITINHVDMRFLTIITIALDRIVPDMVATIINIIITSIKVDKSKIPKNKPLQRQLQQLLQQLLRQLLLELILMRLQIRKKMIILME